MMIDRQPLDPNQQITFLAFDDGSVELQPRQEDKDAVVLDANQVAVLRELLLKRSTQEPEQ
jgi:hypothetical protein